MTRLAIIVPVLDEARRVPLLGEELAAIGCDVEIVIVDGGSRDGSDLALARLGARERIRVLSAPRGRARQMNVGARSTDAPVLLFLHADTVLPPRGVEEASAAIARGAVGGCFRLRIASTDPRLRMAAHLISLRSRLIASATGDQAIFVARDAFERIGGFREIDLCEDLDLVKRLRKLGRFVCLGSHVTTSARRWESRGVSRTIARMWILRLGYHVGVPPAILARSYGPEAR